MKRYALNVRCKSESCSAEPFEIVNGAFVLISDVEPVLEERVMLKAALEEVVACTGNERAMREHAREALAKLGGAP